MKDQPQPHRYRGEVIVRIGVALSAYGQQDAETRARQIVGARTRIRGEEITSVSIQPLTISDLLEYRNRCYWQESEALAIGTSNQRQRWHDGCLPEEELLVLVRDELFRPLALIPRRSRKGPSAVAHEGGMALCAVDGIIPVRWSIEQNPPLDEGRWSTLQRILTRCEEVRHHPWLQQSPATCVRMVVRGHRGVCATCGGTAWEVGTLVEIEWAGRTLTREYVL